MLIATSPDWLQPYRFATFAAPAWARFRAGDHVTVRRGLYWHHAIYVGNGTLIEFGSGVFGGVVARVNWDSFAKDGAVDLVQHGGWAAVQRAEEQLGRNEFDLLTRNCEHFANWCATGRWESGQAQLVTVVGLAALLVLVAKAA